MAELEQVLLHLNQFGQPRLSRMDAGWYCACEMFVSAAGADVKIKSEFNHTTPTQAAQVCLERVSAVVRDISRLADHKALPHG
jgi:hypothetical protein